MKNIKKLLSIVMVLTLVLALGAQAFAVDVTINEKNGTEHGTYKAYQLFTLTTTATNADGEAKDGGEGYSYTVNNKYSTLMYSIAGLEGDNANNKGLIDYLNGLEADGIRDFADKVYEALSEVNFPADYTADANGKFDVPQGYYLIFEEGAAGGAVSQVMLDTAGRESITVTTKEDVPSVDKQVADQNDSTDEAQTWGEIADWDIGDDVPFQLKATIPAGTTTPYDTYEVTFHDQESDGLTFDPLSVKVTVNGKKVTEGYLVNFNPGHGDTFDIVFTDIKTVDGFTPDDSVDDVIIVEYTSTLNENAVIGGTGNPNEVNLEYSNNPYDEGTGTTPKDKVVVFTFTLNVDKVDGKDAPLEGAGFTLYKQQPDGSYVQIGEEVKGDGLTKFTFKGLDEGNYKVEETTVPPGYNKADDIEFTVVAEYNDETGENSSVKSLTVKDAKGEVISGEGKTFAVDLTKGELGTKVVNQTGMELPETGGIGTTIFYVVGGILVAAAVILLVTKRRVSEK